MVLETEKQSIHESKKEEYSQEQILDCLYDKPYRCPCCDAEFMERTVRMSELTVVGQDTDLRTYHAPVDPVLYDVIMCRKCGYSSLARTFDNLSFKKAQIITAEISPKFKNMSFPQVFTEDIAINRYKAALICAMLTREKSSEIAYLYMRLAWIYRAKGEQTLENKMMLASFEGFLEAIQKEYFPLIDLDEETTLYTMGDFLARLSKKEQAKMFFAKVLRSDNITPRIKSRIMQNPVMGGGQ